MGERYGRKSTIITTNLDYPDWYDLFQGKALVNALLDRLKDHCITIRIKAPPSRWLAYPAFKDAEEPYELHKMPRSSQ